MSLRRGDACVLCGTPADLTSADGAFLTCRACDVAWSPLEDPQDPAREWEVDYYGDPAILRLHQERRSGMEAIARRLVRASGARGRLLDVGAGVGMLMKAVADRGWSVEGVEPSRTAADCARRRTGAPVYEDLLERLDLPSGRYDAVSVIDTLRSMPEPASFLVAIRRLLVPGGIVMIREEHRRVNDAYNRLFVRKRIGRRDGRRLATAYGQRFSPQSLALALRWAGFETVWTEPSPWFEECPAGRRPGLRLWVKRLGGRCGMLIHRMSGGSLLVLPNFLIFARAGRPAAGR